MKKLSIKFLALLMITSVAFLSCKKEDRFSPSVNSNTNVEERTESRPPINQSEWKLILFQVNDRNETKLFSKYLFVFGEKGRLMATVERKTEIGHWSTGGKLNPRNFIIMFPSFPLSRLSNNQWVIVSQTSTELKLEHISRRGGREYLTFQKLDIQTDYSPID